jgi:putative GTP pyrophosphokinase
MASENWPHDRSYYDLAARQVVSTLEIISAKRAEVFGLPPWTVNFRIKEVENARAKIERKQGARPGYSISSLKDLAGVRAIVDGIHSARRLEAFFRERRVFPVSENDSESFVESPRVDGYRGIHLVFEIEVSAAERVVVPLELQIRTILQHQWAELSKSEFYKSVAEIPPLLLSRMRSLSDVLYCADREADELRRARIMDEGLVGLAQLLRGEVLERLAPGRVEEAAVVGRMAILILEIEKQLRRSLVSSDDVQVRAFDALRTLALQLGELDGQLAVRMEAIVARVRVFVEDIPREW